MKNPFDKLSELYEIFNSECSFFDKSELFVYNGNCIQSIAFLEGSKICLTKRIKNKIRLIGFSYNNELECYTRLRSNQYDYGDEKKIVNITRFLEIRNEKDLMIENLIEWKIIKQKKIQ
tara:strand:- start:1922 stop:2278 length:357 start_codon:yes stop_codon:yes gene_type:complete